MTLRVFIILLIISLNTSCIRENNYQKNVILNKYPITVFDAQDVKITLLSKPKKIISLSLVTDEILSVIADKNKISALSIYSTDKLNSNIIEYAQTIKKKFSLKNLEEIINTKPDLVLVADFDNREQINKLRLAGIQVYTFQLPKNIEQIKNLIQTITKLIAETEKGDKIIQNLNADLISIKKIFNKKIFQTQPTAILIDDLFYIYGKNTSSGELLRLAHIKNLAEKIKVSTVASISKEAVNFLNPDIIFICIYSEEENTINPINIIVNDPSFINLKAVKNKRVYLLNNAHISTISQYIIYGLKDVCILTYPNFFKA